MIANILSWINQDPVSVIDEVDLIGGCISIVMILIIIANRK